MKKIISPSIVLFFCLLLLSGLSKAADVFTDLSSQPSGMIYFNSFTPKSKWDLVHRKYDPAPVRIWGTLSFPQKIEGKIPAMVIAHGSNGVQQSLFDRWAKLLNEMGIATFVVDSFTGRGVTSTMDDQLQLNAAANDADALMALKLLATDPRIDASRIGLIGFSRGAGVALEMTMESFRKGVLDDDLKFVALIAFYPGCPNVWWENPGPELTGAPLLLAMGEKDDYTPAQLCLNFAERMKRDGQSVETHVYPNAYHDFDDTVVYFKYHPAATTANKCPQVLFDMKHGAYFHLIGNERYASLKEVQAELKTCITRGVSTGSNQEQARRAAQDVRVFLTKAFHLPSMPDDQ